MCLLLETCFSLFIAIDSVIVAGFVCCFCLCGCKQLGFTFCLVD